MVYEFEDFRFSEDRGLLRGGEVIPLEPRASALLAYLLQHAGRVVSKDELVENLWDGRAISDAALSTQVRTVRRVLGDDRSQQKFVRTLPKRGFEFVATVTTLETDPGCDETVPGWKTPSLPQRFRYGLIAASALLVIAVVLATAVLLYQQARSRGGPASTPAPLSLAVLPFDNLSATDEYDYLVDAFTEDLITDLSRIQDAFVISRSTTFTYRERDVDAPTVATELGVRFIVEGSLRVEDEKVRVNVQLIDGASDTHVWSDRFDRDLRALFSLQDSVTGRLASALRAELRIAENKRQDPQVTATAWSHALKGNVLLYNRQSLADYQNSYANLMRAIELDPTISLAWSGLAFVHYAAAQGNIPGVSKPNSAELSLDAAMAAAEQDPNNAEAHWLIGAGHVLLGEPERGLPSCETAMALNPNMDCSHVCFGLVLMASGRFEEAIPYFEHALKLNPRFRTFTKHKLLAMAHMQLEQDNAAVEALHRALTGAPNDLFAHLALASALALSGRGEAAQAELADARTLAGGTLHELSELTSRVAWMGPKTDRFIEGLRLAGYDS